MELKLTNQESPMDAGSLLFTAETLAQPGFPSLYTRLSALQRLKVLLSSPHNVSCSPCLCPHLCDALSLSLSRPQDDLSFSVCLHYQYASMDDEIQETRLVSVGKPLVSKLNLHQPRLPRSFSASSSCDLHCFSLPESSSFPDGLDGHLPASETSSIGSASTCWSFYQPGEFPDSPLPAKVNLPEETVSPEFLDPDLPRPLSADIRSLPLDNMERLSLHFRGKQNFSF